MFAWRAGTALTTRNTPIAAMIARRTIPAPVEAKRNGPSPRLRRKADRRTAGPLSLVLIDVAICQEMASTAVRTLASRLDGSGA
ncbi:hypothetical protein GCM10010116_11190 [Microbispora rosea subsp. aerata]|nr:hypothetical protein GCM10010116_11190 [Microbispora rosea subsp. aerata]GIH57305.1 hypothetical protein Mro02_42190 [Microbispora rosea subsp. aerata]GLJ83446.1 hypothetical protein GCM10017588_21740 [Microbispora rosea subsp. aerata]